MRRLYMSAVKQVFKDIELYRVWNFWYIISNTDMPQGFGYHLSQYPKYQPESWQYKNCILSSSRQQQLESGCQIALWMRFTAYLDNRRIGGASAKDYMHKHPPIWLDLWIVLAYIIQQNYPSWSVTWTESNIRTMTFSFQCRIDPAWHFQNRWTVEGGQRQNPTTRRDDNGTIDDDNLRG